MNWISLIGLAMAALGAVSYLLMIFVFGGFTYRTWIFHGTIAAGVVVATVGWLAGEDPVYALATLVIATVWVVLTWKELGIAGSDRLRIRPGSRLPDFALVTTDGTTVTNQDVVAEGPALLVFYRGWWCPTHKAQLDEIVEAHERLSRAGFSVWAASVDLPEESQPIQDRVGDAVTVLCGVDDALLSELGIRDDRGAPWYDRLLFGAKDQEIAMPTAIVVDGAGTVRFASRSTRLDGRAAPEEILAALGPG